MRTITIHDSIGNDPYEVLINVSAIQAVEHFHDNTLITINNKTLSFSDRNKSKYKQIVLFMTEGKTND